jgi:hypothetical protein
MLLFSLLDPRMFQSSPAKSSQWIVADCSAPIIAGRDVERGSKDDYRVVSQNLVQISWFLADSKVE